MVNISGTDHLPKKQKRKWRTFSRRDYRRMRGVDMSRCLSRCLSVEVSVCLSRCLSVALSRESVKIDIYYDDAWIILGMHEQHSDNAQGTPMTPG